MKPRPPGGTSLSSSRSWPPPDEQELNNTSALRGSAIDMAGADLRRVRWVRADLRGAMLAGADLREADLREARLEGADLRGAKLQGARLLLARYDPHTRWPDDVHPDALGAVCVRRQNS